MAGSLLPKTLQAGLASTSSRHAQQKVAPRGSSLSCSCSLPEAQTTAGQDTPSSSRRNTLTIGLGALVSSLSLQEARAQFSDQEYDDFLSLSTKAARREDQKPQSQDEEESEVVGTDIFDQRDLQETVLLDGETIQWVDFDGGDFICKVPKGYRVITKPVQKTVFTDDLGRRRGVDARVRFESKDGREYIQLQKGAANDLGLTLLEVKDIREFGDPFKVALKALPEGSDLIGYDEQVIDQGYRFSKLTKQKIKRPDQHIYRYEYKYNNAHLISSFVIRRGVLVEMIGGTENEDWEGSSATRVASVVRSFKLKKNAVVA